MKHCYKWLCFSFRMASTPKADISAMNTSSNLEKCNDEKKVYVLGCDFCETTFIRQADLMKHKKNNLINADGSSKFVCSICGEKVCNRKLLKTHIRCVHGSDKKCLETSLSQEDSQVKTPQIFGCDLCEKTFSRKDSLFIHKATHKTTKSFTCEHCLTEFSLNKNFVRHRKESLDKRGNLRHKCPICDKSFCTERFLTAHMKFGHAEEFICTVCKQKFSSKYHWERHHINKTSFACEECKEYFCHKRGFSKHMKVVHLM